MSLIIFSLLLLIITSAISGEDYVHSPIQYHSQTDSGAYNYGYDTGLYGSHQFHQEHKDGHGDVRGRYGYTDPNGKLRLVQYKSGPKGFEIISDTEQDKSSDQKVNKKYKTGSINSIGSYRSPPARSSNKPVYSEVFYSNSVQPTTPRIRKNPILSRTYRESNNENTRFYRAGRDYSTQPNLIERPIHVRASSHSTRVVRPATMINTHTLANTRRDNIHSHNPYSHNTHSHDIHSHDVHSHDIHSHGIHNRIESPEPYISSRIYTAAPTPRVPETYPISRVHSTAPTAVESFSNFHSYSPLPAPAYSIEPIPAVPFHTPVPADAYTAEAALGAPISRRVPVIYSGRGILSPVARLRAGALAGRTLNGVRARRSSNQQQ